MLPIVSTFGPYFNCQLSRIARRGLELLAVGGRMVYSTCRWTHSQTSTEDNNRLSPELMITIDSYSSLNPVENEAVVGRLLAEAGESLQLIEVSRKHTSPTLLLCGSSVTAILLSCNSSAAALQSADSLF